MRRKNKEKEECIHSFVKYPPKIGKLRVCKKCGFLWVLGDVKFGRNTIKLSGSGNYIESSTTTAPANPVSGKIRLYATSGTSLRMRDSTGTETDLAAAGGVLYNYLTNPGFEIWQRGAGPFTASGAYTCDRHYISLAGTDTISVTRAGLLDADTVKDTDSISCLKGVFTLGTGAGASAIRNPVGANLANDLENIVRLRGRTIVYRARVRTATAAAVRAYIRTDGTGGTTTESTAHSGGGTFESLDVSITVPTDATYLDVGVRLAATSTFYMDNETLVIGSTAQTYYPLHPAEEWERCQRYYEQQPQAGTVGGGLFAFGFWATTAQHFDSPVAFMTRKAVLPTLTKVGTWTVVNTAQPTMGSPDITGFFLDSLTAGAGYCQVYVAASTAYVTAEANP